MSETEEHVGKLRKIEIPIGYDTVQGQMIYLLSKEYDLGDCDIEDGYIYGDGNVVIVSGVFYEIVSKREVDEYSDTMIANRCSDGTIDFHVKYYNGGCCFSEALETSFDIMNKKPVI